MYALEDVLMVKEVLLQPDPQNLPASVTSMLESIVDIVRTKYMSEVYIPPESLVELLFVEASFVAADASLDKFQHFSMHDFRQVASRIHEACFRLAEEHSHVNPRSIVKTLSRRWLVHGDSDISKSTEIDSTEKSHPRKNDQAFEEDDTRDFVMDLNSFVHGKEMWSDDIGFSDQSSSLDKKLSVGEEPHGLKARGSTRERVEYENARACLRIAFVLSFAQHYFDLSTRSSVAEADEEHSKENRPSNDRNSTLLLRSETQKASRANFTKQSDKTSHSATEHARELLQIAFTDVSGRTQSPEKLFLQDSKTITFAMRHRALRTAVILCPNDVLHAVVMEKEYIPELDTNAIASHFERCKIASYVAMEIEDMGLPLPHSDLAQLSMMHFSSYARALWRYHGESDCLGYRGRLLHLLIDLCTQGQSIDDAPLVVNVINEIKKRKLPRTMLSAIERIVDCELAALRVHVIKNVASDDGEKILAQSLTFTAQGIIEELKQSLNSTLDENECYDMLRRLTKVTLILTGLGMTRINLSLFASELCSTASVLSSMKPKLARRILRLAFQSARRVSTEEERNVLLSMLHDIEVSLGETSTA